MQNRRRTRWIRVEGKLQQIDSGPFGCVWGTDRQNRIWYRTKITWKLRQGRKWGRIPGALKYASCGQYGAWGVNKYGYIYFRRGVTNVRPQGMQC